MPNDTSSVWNFCTRFSDVISRGNQWWRRVMSAVFSGCFLIHWKETSKRLTGWAIWVCHSASAIPGRLIRLNLKASASASCIFSRRLKRVKRLYGHRLLNNYSSSPNGLWVNSPWGHEGERNNCFSKIQLVAQKYRNKTTLASETRFSRHCSGFQSRRFSLLMGYNI